MSEPVEETPATETQTEAPEAKGPTRRERQETIFEQFTSQAGAEEPAAEAKPDADGTEKSQAGVEAKPDETPAAEVWVAPTPEQLRDKAWWGGLSKDGWERAEREHPVEASHVKASQAAGTKIVNDARAEAERILAEARAKAAPATEERHEARQDEEPSAELLECIQTIQTSIDPVEIAKAEIRKAELLAPIIAKHAGIDVARNQREAIEDAAYEAAVAEQPELAGFKGEEIAAVVKASAPLATLVEIHTPAALKAALIGAGEILIGRKKAAAATTAATEAAAAAKKKETQKVVQSNGRTAAAAALASHGASPDTRTTRQRLDARYDAEVARQGH